MPSKAISSLVLGLSLGLVACEPVRDRPPARQVPGGDESRGRVLLAKYGCGSCHVIPGVDGAVGLSAAPLDHFAERGFVGGILPNNADNLITWIVDPRSVNERTAMPNLGVTTHDARDMAAYLYMLRRK
jgi:cytochrome c